MKSKILAGFVGAPVAMALAWLMIEVGGCVKDPPQGRPERVGRASHAVVERKFGQNNAPCTFECDAGQVRTCGNFCVTPVGIGDECNHNHPGASCESDSVCEGSEFGPLSASCVGPLNDAGLFQCADPPLGLKALEECDPGQDPDLCPANTFCRNDAVFSRGARRCPAATRSSPKAGFATATPAQ